MHDGASWPGVLTALRAGDLEFLDHPYGNVFKSLRMSVEALEPEIAERYGELAVFPEDVAIPAATIERLWAFTGGVSAVRSRALLANLSRKSLLSLAQAHNRGTVGFHDLHQDFLKLNADDLPGLHARLLDAYRPPRGARADLPSDEPYLWSWLCYHLAEAERAQELRSVLLDPSWIAAKLAATDVASLLGDYAQASDREVALVGRALMLSANVIGRDPAQLPGQLTGRLQGVARDGIARLLDAAGATQDPAWFRPRTRSLTPRGPELRRFEGHQDGVCSVAVLADGRRALSASDDRTLRLWDLETGACLVVFTGDAAIAAVAVVSDDLFVAGSANGAIHILELCGPRATARTMSPSGRSMF